MSLSDEAEKFRRGLIERRDAYNRRLEAAVVVVADDVTNRIKDRIPPDVLTTSGMTNAFPGYAATGDLKGSFGHGPVTKEGSAYTVTVGQPGASGFNIMKGIVHEHGWVIRPKRPGGYLVFQIEGQWVKTKRVQIKAKHFFQAGFESAQSEGQSVLENALNSTDSK